MSITRKRFLGSVTGGTVTLLIQACGGDGNKAFLSLFGGGNGDGANGGQGAPSSCGSSDGQISGNHGHALTVPTTDLTSTIAITYSIIGSATHDHSLTLSASDLAALNSGGTVTEVSSVTDAAPFGPHSHSVTVTCV